MPLVVGIGELLWDLLPDGRQMGGGLPERLTAAMRR